MNLGVMSGCLSGRKNISGERLIAAWRWFEEIPDAAPESPYGKSKIDAIVEGALSAAKQQDLLGLDDRIRGALQRVGEESIRQRFERLVGSLKERFGTNATFDGMPNYLMLARGFRGRVAHGHFEANGADELTTFHKATLALEAFCFLLTARDLPMSERAIRQIWMHPVVEDFMRAYPFEV